MHCTCIQHWQDLKLHTCATKITRCCTCLIFHSYALYPNCCLNSKHNQNVLNKYGWCNWTLRHHSSCSTPKLHACSSSSVDKYLLIRKVLKINLMLKKNLNSLWLLNIQKCMKTIVCDSSYRWTCPPLLLSFIIIFNLTCHM